MKINTPYFTMQYLLREFAKGFGTKGLTAETAKEIDDACKENEITPQQLAKLKQLLIHEPLSKYVNVYFADHVIEQVDKVFEQYLEVMESIPLEGVNAGKAQAIIKKYFMSFSVANICSSCLEGMRITPFEFSQLNLTMFDFTFNNLRRSSDWCEFEDKCTKEQKDRFRVWSLGEGSELPDISRIGALGKQWQIGNSWGTLKARLVIARFWDHFFYRDGLCDLQLIRDVLPEYYASCFEQSLIETRAVEINRYEPLSHVAEEIMNLLLLRKPKSEADRDKCSELLSQFKIDQDKLDVNNEVTYNYHWMYARFCLHQGKLDDALASYKLAFNLVLYRNAVNAQKIIREAIMVTCRMAKPDKVFINRLRRMAVIFAIDIQLSEYNKPENKKKCEDIESWEISVFAKDFSSFFPKESFFPGAEYPSLNVTKYGFWMFNDEDYKLDLRRPNKNFKVGSEGSLVKKMPQVVFFSMQNNIDAVKQLVEAGADINKLSESGESAILLAIQEMDATEYAINSMSQELFDYIATLPHTAECLNTKTLKRKLTPLGCAIDTGRLDVVKKVISLGANVDTRYGTDIKTSLFGVLGLIANHTRPQVVKNTIETQKYTDEALQAIRAYSAGLLPQDLEQLKKHLVSKEGDPLWQAVEEVGLKLIQNNIQKYTTINELREIGLFLISQKASPNAKHNSGMQGYTPFMLAAENNEAELFKAMRSAGGDMRDTCFDSVHQRRADLRVIAHHWRSKDIVPLLN